MKKYYVYSIVFMLIALYSCKNTTTDQVEESSEEGISVNIEHSAGDNWESNDNFLPLPFNVAKHGTESVIVLSERIQQGESLDIKAIGAVRIMQNDSLFTYVVSIPTDNQLTSFSIGDFDEFSTVHSGAKWIIEQYLLNRTNTYSVKLKSWENENFAINYLIK